MPELSPQQEKLVLVMFDFWAVGYVRSKDDNDKSPLASKRNVITFTASASVLRGFLTRG